MCTLDGRGGGSLLAPRRRHGEPDSRHGPHERRLSARERRIIRVVIVAVEDGALTWGKAGGAHFCHTVVLGGGRRSVVSIRVIWVRHQPAQVSERVVQPRLFRVCERGGCTDALSEEPINVFRNGGYTRCVKVRCGFVFFLTFSNATHLRGLSLLVSSPRRALWPAPCPTDDGRALRGPSRTFRVPPPPHTATSTFTAK